LETGANDVLVVRPRKDSIDDRERLIPYLKESVIKKIDVTNNEVIVNWEINFLE
jgi:16S rRNA processing protein RimM